MAKKTKYLKFSVYVEVKGKIDEDFDGCEMGDNIAQAIVDDQYYITGYADVKLKDVYAEYEGVDPDRK